MNRINNKSPEEAQSPERARQDAAIASFRAALIAGERPQIEDVLSPSPEAARSPLLRSLLVLELGYRFRIGERPTRDEYRARFVAREETVEEAFRHPAIATLATGTGGAEQAPVTPNEYREGDAGEIPLAPDPAVPDREAVGDLSASRFGDYQLLEVVARDEDSVVYKARQLSLDRVVALKMIMTGTSVSSPDEPRFYGEAKAAAELDHPGIVPIFEIGRHQGQYFVSMGFIEGQSLAQKTASATLSPRDAAELMKQVAETIAFAHGKGVMHRNLTPKNILLNARGRAKVAGFSLSATHQSEGPTTMFRRAVGSPVFLAPEQVREDREIGPRTDVYAIGAILYFLLTGRPPFQGSDLVTTLSKIVNQAPRPLRRINPSIPAELESVCLKCLRKQPGRRYQTAAAVADDLGRWLRGERFVSDLERPIERIGRAVRGHPGAIGMGS